MKCLRDARALCREVIQRPSRPKRYAQISRGIMQALHDITPDIEVYSVDEAFLDVTHCQRLHGNPALMGKMPNVIAPAWKPDGHRQTV